MIGIFEMRNLIPRFSRLLQFLDQRSGQDEGHDKKKKNTHIFLTRFYSRAISSIRSSRNQTVPVSLIAFAD